MWSPLMDRIAWARLAESQVGTRSGERRDGVGAAGQVREIRREAATAMILRTAEGTAV